MVGPEKNSTSRACSSFERGKEGGGVLKLVNNDFEFYDAEGSQK